MTLDKESRIRLRAEARAVYQEFAQLRGTSSEVLARRAELERRYHEINEIIANERTELTAEAERIPVELAAIIGNEPGDQAERARLMARYEEIHAILKKKPKSFDEGTATAAPDADEEEVADWTEVSGASETVVASTADLSLAGLDNAVEAPAADSGAKTVLGQIPEGFEPLPDEDSSKDLVEEMELSDSLSSSEDRPAAEEVPPESDFELPAPKEETTVPEEKEAFGLEAFNLSDVLDDDQSVGETDAELGKITSLPDPDELKSDSGAQEKGTAWADFDDSNDDDDKADGGGEDDGWVLPALSEENEGAGGNGKSKDTWDDEPNDLPPLQDFVPEDNGNNGVAAFDKDPLLNVTSIGDGEVQRKSDEIPLPAADEKESSAAWGELPDHNA